MRRRVESTVQLEVKSAEMRKTSFKAALFFMAGFPLAIYLLLFEMKTLDSTSCSSLDTIIYFTNSSETCWKITSVHTDTKPSLPFGSAAAGFLRSFGLGKPSRPR